MSDIGTYIGSVLLNFWTVVAGVMIAVEPVTRFLWHGYDEWAANWLSAARRKKLARVGAMMAFVIANYMAYHGLKEELRDARSQNEGQIGRHLSKDQRARMTVNLRLAPDEKYAFQVNSSPSCDECELFAEEIREFLNTIPGWEVSGSPLIFAQPFRRGLRIISREDEKHIPPVEKLNKAFSDSGLLLIHESKNALERGGFVIVIGRPGT